MARIDVILKAAREQGASDVHVMSGSPPVLRIHGEVRRTDLPALTPEQSRQLLFVHVNKESLVNQREVGRHAKGFAEALRSALREDPDIILVGEMRDRETMSLALTAAEVGQLVFATLHSASAAQTVSRIIDVLPADEQEQVRTVLSESLRGGRGAAPLAASGRRRARRGDRVLFVTPAISALVREKKTTQILSAMQVGKKDGMQLMEEAIQALIREGKVSQGVAGAGTRRPAERAAERRAAEAVARGATT